MIRNIVKGSGVTGAIRYVMGEGNDPITGERLKLEPGKDAHAEIIGGQNFGFAIDSEERLEVARRMMEWNAKPENQAGHTKKCVRDCLHMTLSWDAGQNPSREEMERAAKEALKAQGMERAQAIFVAHHDTDHKHLHIVASRLDPETGRTFSDTNDMPKAQAWGLKWERENGQESRARDELHRLAKFVDRRDPGGVLELMSERQSTFTAKELDRALRYGSLDDQAREKLKLDILAHNEVIGLRVTADAPVTRYTTREVLAAEREVLRDAARMSERYQHGLADGRARAVAARANLSEEQTSALHHCTKAGGFAMIAGEAGTGKSRTLNAIRQAYEAERYRVIGMAWTNAVVQDMRAGGFTESSTIAAEMKRQEHGARAWNASTVLMIDEAAMLAAPVRSAGRYRIYDAADVRRLAFIRRARDLGFTLEEIRTLLALSANAAPGPCIEARELAARHLTAVRAKIGDLKAMERVLADAVRRCSVGEMPGCPIIDAIAAV